MAAMTTKEWSSKQPIEVEDSSVLSTQWPGAGAGAQRVCSCCPGHSPTQSPLLHVLDYNASRSTSCLLKTYYVPVS
jgi:hypothetical protein